jgi:hypothetical protein
MTSRDYDAIVVGARCTGSSDRPPVVGHSFDFGPVVIAGNPHPATGVALGRSVIERAGVGGESQRRDGIVAHAVGGNHLAAMARVRRARRR